MEEDSKKIDMQKDINSKEQKVEKNDEKQNSQKFKKSDRQPKIKNTFVKKYILFILLLFIITGIAIYFTIQYLNNNVTEEEERVETSENVVEEKSEVVKKTAEDSKFGIKNYTETYNENDIKIIYYADADGKISTIEKEYMVPSGQIVIKYIQIDGLKDKSIQNRINERLKQEAYNLKENATEETITSTVSANFSNVLSVIISEYNRDTDTSKDVNININLSTGEDIPFEKIFVSSAPINSFLAEGLYENLAWKEQSQKQAENLETGEWDLDMKDVDTSKYEDEFLKIANQYKKIKDNIQYYFETNGVTVFGLYKDNIRDGIKIKFVNHLEEVAIYKRYLTSESIFENDNLGEKNIVVCTLPSFSKDTYTILNYGKIKDNIFMEDVTENWSDNDELKGIENVQKSLKKISDEQKEKINEDSGKGMFYQRVMHIEEDSDKGYYVISLKETKTTCDISYFKDKAFRDFIHMKNRATAAAIYRVFENNMKEDYPNLTIASNDYYEEKNEMYFSPSGEYLGSTEEDALAKLGKTDTKTEQIPQEEQIQNQEKNQESSNTNIVTNTNSNNTNVINNNTNSNKKNTTNTQQDSNNKNNATKTNSSNTDNINTLNTI